MRGYFSAYHLFTDTLDSFKYCKIIRYNDGVMRRNQSTAVARGRSAHISILIMHTSLRTTSRPRRVTDHQVVGHTDGPGMLGGIPDVRLDGVRPATVEEGHNLVKANHWKLSVREGSAVKVFTFF